MMRQALFVLLLLALAFSQLTFVPSLDSGKITRNTFNVSVASGANCALEINGTIGQLAFGPTKYFAPRAGGVCTATVTLDAGNYTFKMHSPSYGNVIASGTYEVTPKIPGGCAACENLGNTTIAYVFPVKNEGLHRFEILLVGENSTDISQRFALNYSPVLVYMHNESYSRLVKAVTGQDGKAYINYDQDTCLQYSFMYCCFYVECGFLECVKAFGIKDEYIEANNIKNISDIPLGDGASDYPLAEPKSAFPAIEKVDVCPDNSLGNLAAALCFPLTLLAGLLFASMSLAGKNPFMGFDIGSIRLGRHIKYTPMGVQRGMKVTGEVATRKALSVVGSAVGRVKAKHKKEDAAAIGAGKKPEKRGFGAFIKDTLKETVNVKGIFGTLKERYKSEKASILPSFLSSKKADSQGRAAPSSLSKDQVTRQLALGGGPEGTGAAYLGIHAANSISSAWRSSKDENGKVNFMKFLGNFVLNVTGISHFVAAGKQLYAQKILSDAKKQSNEEFKAHGQYDPEKREMIKGKPPRSPEDILAAWRAEERISGDVYAYALASKKKTDQWAAMSTGEQLGNIGMALVAGPLGMSHLLSTGMSPGEAYEVIEKAHEFRTAKKYKINGKDATAAEVLKDPNARKEDKDAVIKAYSPFLKKTAAAAATMAEMRRDILDEQLRFARAEKGKETVVDNLSDANLTSLSSLDGKDIAQTIIKAKSMEELPERLKSSPLVAPALDLYFKTREELASKHDDARVAELNAHTPFIIQGAIHEISDPSFSKSKDMKDVLTIYGKEMPAGDEKAQEKMLAKRSEALEGLFAEYPNVGGLVDSNLYAQDPYLWNQRKIADNYSTISQLGGVLSTAVRMRADVEKGPEHVSPPELGPGAQPQQEPGVAKLESEFDKSMAHYIEKFSDTLAATRMPEIQQIAQQHPEFQPIMDPTQAYLRLTSGVAAYTAYEQEKRREELTGLGKAMLTDRYFEHHPEDKALADKHGITSEQLARNDLDSFIKEQIKAQSVSEEARKMLEKHRYIIADAAFCNIAKETLSDFGSRKAVDEGMEKARTGLLASNEAELHKAQDNLRQLHTLAPPPVQKKYSLEVNTALKAGEFALKIR